MRVRQRRTAPCVCVYKRAKVKNSIYSKKVDFSRHRMADVVLDLYAEDLDKDFAGQAQVSESLESKKEKSRRLACVYVYSRVGR